MAPIVKTGLIILLCNYLIASICGVEAHSDAGTITSDDPTVANLGQFPYQVSLQDWYSDVHFCSGAIITDQWVLTAASCIYGLASKKQIKAVVGTNQLTKGTYYKIRRAFTYQETDNYHRDIALLKTKSKMVFNENVSPIELPKQVARVNEKVVVSGWGNSVFSPKRPENHQDPESAHLEELHFEKTLVLPNYECKERLAAIHMAREVHEWNVCTLNKTGLCYVDHGSPLVNGQLELVAIASFGRSCVLGYPDVFTSVYEHLAWIQKITNRSDSGKDDKFNYPDVSKNIDHYVLTVKGITEKPDLRLNLDFNAVEKKFE